MARLEPHPGPLRRSPRQRRGRLRLQERLEELNEELETLNAEARTLADRISQNAAQLLEGSR